MITVEKICKLHIEPNEEVMLWDIDDCITIFRGTAKEVLNETAYGPKAVHSINVEDGIICMNIAVKE